MTDLDLLTVLSFCCAVGFLGDILIDSVVDCLCWIVRRWSE